MSTHREENDRKWRSYPAAEVIPNIKTSEIEAGYNFMKASASTKSFETMETTKKPNIRKRCEDGSSSKELFSEKQEEKVRKSTDKEGKGQKIYSYSKREPRIQRNSCRASFH